MRKSKNSRKFLRPTESPSGTGFASQPNLPMLAIRYRGHMYHCYARKITAQAVFSPRGADLGTFCSPTEVKFFQQLLFDHQEVILSLCAGRSMECTLTWDLTNMETSGLVQMKITPKDESFDGLVSMIALDPL